MNDYKQVDEIVLDAKNNGKSKADTVVIAANATIGWPYVWGASGKHLCTVANRKMYMNSSKIAKGDIELIKKKCPILSGKQTTCDGCQYYPNHIGVYIEDCQGYIKKLFEYVGITFSGGGCTSMWNAAKNWASKGTIDSLPKDKVCCTFRDVNGTKEHILLYDGNGNYIHDSGEVKKQAISTYKATHWAIPAGLYAEPTPTPEKGTAIVTGKQVALRVGPTTKARILMRIQTGKVVKIETPPADWTYCSYSGYTGYMMKKYLSINGDTATVTGKQLALRCGPTTEAAIILRVQTGKTVQIADPPEGWEYVSYMGKSGYMMKQFIQEG